MASYPVGAAAFPNGVILHSAFSVAAVSDINDLDLPAPCTADGEGGVQDSARQRAKRAARGRLDTFWRGAIIEPKKSSVSSLRGKTP